MNAGFQSRAAFVVTTDGRRFTFLKPITYVAKDGTIYVIPEGATTDGASTPREIWDVLPPFGEYWLDCAIHDCAYQNTLQIESKNTANPILSLANLTKEQSDNLLLEAMELTQVDKADAKVIFEGVKLGGWKAFKEDRA